jgi:5-methylcytosine-specific restriction endonuclease McrA
MHQDPPRNFERIEVLSRHNSSCFVCGTRESFSNHLTVHHIVPHCFGGKDELDNLIPLCRLCYRTVHKSLEAYIRSMFMSHASPRVFQQILEKAKSPNYSNPICMEPMGIRQK